MEGKPWKGLSAVRLGYEKMSLRFDILHEFSTFRLFDDSLSVTAKHSQLTPPRPGRVPTQAVYGSRHGGHTSFGRQWIRDLLPLERSDPEREGGDPS